jgi:endoribonuclease Dicer
MINLLVFDEVHHAKKNHPYAKIIGDFYKPYKAMGHARRPRVFGMTASPIDAKVDLVIASRDLEELVDCKIATYELKAEYKNKAQELTLTYARLQDPFKTVLHALLEEELGNMPSFRRLFETAMYLSSQLGAWASEKYWEFALREQEKNKAQSKLEKAHGKQFTRDVKSMDAQIEQLNRAHDLVTNYHFRKPRMTLEDLSSKVYELNLFLNEHYRDDLQNRCIVFVEQKATARMLVLLFHEIGATYLRPGVLTGHAAKGGDEHVSFRQQVLTMTKFRKGEINCLFATSVAEEGLDVPDCNLVIRFDLYKTVIQYVQSKGRARHKNSKFVDMAEKDNTRDQSIRNEARRQEQMLLYWISNLDEKRKIGGNDQEDTTQRLGREFVHQKSQAKLTYWSALGVLSLFTSTLVLLLSTYFDHH